MWKQAGFSPHYLNPISVMSESVWACPPFLCRETMVLGSRKRETYFLCPITANLPLPFIYVDGPGRFFYNQISNGQEGPL